MEMGCLLWGEYYSSSYSLMIVVKNERLQVPVLVENQSNQYKVTSTKPNLEKAPTSVEEFAFVRLLQSLGFL